MTGKKKKKTLRNPLIPLLGILLAFVVVGASFSGCLNTGSDRIRVAIDAAYGGSDYTAFTCAAKLDGKIYLYGRLWHQSVDRVLPEIIALADRFQCWPLYCEQNGDKGFLMKEIRRMDRWAKTYTEHENKMIKIGTYLRKHWPHIRFLTGTDPEYIDQILDYNPSAAHDDAPDSAACVCRLLDSGTGWGCRWT